MQIGGSVEEASPADFDRSFAVNVRAHAVVCGAAVPHLRATGGEPVWGSTASNSALLSEPHLAPYAVTKAAALALPGGELARGTSSEGIRVNALCPGWIDTPFNTPAWENFGGRERFLAEVPRLVPLGRIGTPEEAARLACFLLSDEASFMTGHALVADGSRAFPDRRPALLCARRLRLPAAGGAPLPARQVRASAAARGEPKLELHDARAATREELLLGHTPDWVARADGELSRDEERALGLPWSPQLFERARRSVGGTLEASAAALADGAGANLGGGTHHAFPAVGHAFCVFNDVVIATRSLRGAEPLEARARGRLRRAPGRRHARGAGRR